ncbi:MAG TPA: hypothetical protein PKY40_15415, partial [Burkholderiaceae bacterium]|nr:hypothetical protein [Burkholderiaceae bacterium]
MIATKRANREVVPDAWVKRLADLSAQQRGEKADDGAVYSLEVEGHPMYDGRPVLRNLVPIKVSSVADAQRKLDNANTLEGKVAKEFYAAQYDLKQAKTAAQKKAAKARLDKLNNQGWDEDALKALRDTTIAELSRLVDAAQEKFGAAPQPTSGEAAPAPAPEAAPASAPAERTPAQEPGVSTAEQVATAQELLAGVPNGEHVSEEDRKAAEQALGIYSLNALADHELRRMLSVLEVNKANTTKVLAMSPRPRSINDIADALGALAGAAAKKAEYERAFKRAADLAPTNQAVADALNVYAVQKVQLESIASERGMYGVKWAERNIGQRWTTQSIKVRKAKDRVVEAVRAAPTLTPKAQAVKEALAAKKGEQPKRDEYPLGKTDREDRFFGTRVRVLPELKGDTAWEGVIQMTLNGGRLFSVKRADNDNGSFRIGGDRLEILEVKDAEKADTKPKEPTKAPASINLLPLAEKWDALVEHTKTDGGDPDKGQRSYRALTQLIGGFEEKPLEVWDRWSTAMGSTGLVDLTGPQVLKWLEANLPTALDGYIRNLPGATMSSTNAGDVRYWQNALAEIERRTPDYNRYVDKLEKQALDVERLGGDAERVAEARKTIDRVKRAFNANERSAQQGLASAEGREKAEAEKRAADEAAKYQPF